MAGRTVKARDRTPRGAVRDHSDLARGPSTAFVYVLRCVDGSLYCGWTNDLDRRIDQHRAGRASRYTRSRLPVELAWSREMRSRSDAMREEARIKRLSREDKVRLVGLAG